MSEPTRFGPNPTSQGVRGYRDLAPDEVALINRIKETEETIGDLWGEVARSSGVVDARWMAVARTHLQEGFTALVRAIAKPADPFEKALRADPTAWLDTPR